MDEKITFVGLNKLTDGESVSIRKICEQEFDKVQRSLADSRLRLKVKTMNPEGNAREYEFTALLESSKARFEASKTGWNLSVTLHDLFSSLHNQAKKKLKLKE